MHIFKVLHSRHLLSKRLQNACQNQWIFRSKIGKKSTQKRIEKTCFFWHRFFIEFSLIWARFGRVLGRVCRPFWRPERDPKGQNSFFQWNCDFWRIWGWFGEGFGRGLGEVWGGFGAFWEDFERSGSTLGALGALCCVLHAFAAFYVFLHILAVETLKIVLAPDFSRPGFLRNLLKKT